MFHHYRRPVVIFAAFFIGLAPASVVTLDLAETPSAQARSGGSGGGFSRSSSGGSRSSSGSSRSSSGSSRRSSSGSSRSSSGGSYSSGGASVPMTPEEAAFMTTAVIIFILIALLVSLVGKLRRRAADKRARLRNTVARIQVALNALKTKGMRADIEALVRNSDVSSSVGLGMLAHRVCLSIADHKEHIDFAHVLADERLEDAPAEAQFNRLAGEARDFFDREVVRRDARGIVEGVRNSDKANELLDEDGSFGIDEYFVVTLVVCVEAVDLKMLEAEGAQFDAPMAATALTGIATYRFAGCEVVWTPAAESDILTRDEVLAEFPQLAPVIAGAL